MRRMREAGVWPRALCVEASVERCLGQAAIVTEQDWRAAPGRSCGPDCLVIETIQGPG